ncbi:30S ribosomal protein S9 [Synechocystis salina LEGE 06155]|jgi:small subunit ribosomal protein S9|uniref:Small ribosomal subunit protein uS9 n=2 Tax=Synechocystis TaxID=1142 RepID=RS9_SYNY3|nr:MULTISPECIES: 30S ribosomal protein S9 [Synechocystis]P73293.1 RecName: Full=Small ribosomal subunit protein uS9; AltName: Full=30S ribosomal protein S9 [Synechocystis sp. PCC 6803 substr. Kazusa]MBE9175265.1 30S ribosomal protein S9 [Synechocystis salina LEGE 06155]WLT37546.1 30S ribosomal protein S9 [Synechocystis sp. B12]BAM51045.1 30S ribosomal protein S9 [Synechocystis sp. PCC 6803] [Bacillus subtilis BEST7613]AGF51010.1 30S ribosomal protein S9 [Synechocystis sp. PCC 6803]ALJ67049.1 
MQANDSSNKVVYWGTGRRKAAIARVRLVPGQGEVIVNGKPGEIYFNRIANYIQSLKAPLETLGLEGEYNILVNAHGGGLTGQADAVKLGVARALCQLSPENRQPLKAEGYLTRDPRAKERKKYGLHKARKAPQYSKR